MPRSCPHCRTWLAIGDEAACPKCFANLTIPVEPQDDDDRYSSLDKAAITGNVVQILFAAPLAVLVLGGILYGLGLAIGRKNVVTTIVFAALMLGWLGFLYALWKAFRTSTRGI